MIKIYDNVFSKCYAGQLWTYVKHSLYGLGWQDSDSLEYANRVCLHSVYSDVDLKNIRLLEMINKTALGKIVNTSNLRQCIVNLALPGQTYIEHTHENEDVLLIYCNEVWRREWAGETMFYSDNNMKLLEAVEYVPNRAVFFSGEHPHALRPPAYSATDYRFTISLFFPRD